MHSSGGCNGRGLSCLPLRALTYILDFSTLRWENGQSAQPTRSEKWELCRKQCLSS